MKATEKVKRRGKSYEDAEREVTTVLWKSGAIGLRFRLKPDEPLKFTLSRKAAQILSAQLALVLEGDCDEWTEQVPADEFRWVQVKP